MYIDTSSMLTYVPSSYFDVIMKELMAYSVGFFYDNELHTFVLDCAQRDIMRDIYIRFLDNANTMPTNWFSIQPIDYMSEIDNTEVCQVMLAKNTKDEWIMGLNFLNQYTVDFKITDSDSGVN